MYLAGQKPAQIHYTITTGQVERRGGLAPSERHASFGEDGAGEDHPAGDLLPRSLTMAV
jgi:hypothetical protein